MQTLYLDCFLPLSDEAKNLVVAQNQVLVRKFNSSISFEQDFEPHITLFMGIFPAGNLGRIKRKLQAVANSQKSFSFKLSQYSISAEGYLFWEVIPEPQLQRIHHKVVDAINPLREGLIRDKFQTQIDTYSKSEKHCIKEFGFPWVLDLFKPHVTLAKVDSATKSSSEFSKFATETSLCSINASRIELGLVGENGVVKPTGDCFLFSK